MPVETEGMEWFNHPAPDIVEGEVFNNVVYIVPLAKGHSPQFGDGEMVDSQLAIVETYFAGKVDDMVRRMLDSENPAHVLAMEVTDVTLYALQRIANHTPVDLGIAKAGWGVLLPLGKQSDAVEEGFAGPPKSSDQSRWPSRRGVTYNRDGTPAGRRPKG